MHGLHSTQAGYRPRAQAAARTLGATSLTFDLGGHGLSDGERPLVTPRENLAETLAAYDMLAAAPGVDHVRIGVCGASYGGYLAALVAAERDVKRLFLRAPALYPDDWLDVPLGARGKLVEAPRSRAVEAVRRFGGDVLVLESEHDEVIPHAVVQAYLQSGGHVRHEVLAGARHRLAERAWEETFVRLLLEWFRAL